MHSVSWSGWAALAVTVAVLLSIDLFAHRRDRPPSRRAAIAWTVFWVAAALLFGAGVTWRLGSDAGEEYFAAWLLEKSLSVDNLLLFLVIFKTLGLAHGDQRRVLGWGILGAIVARGLFIAAGSAALDRWHWLIYGLGALLIALGVKLLRNSDDSAGANRLLDWLRKRLPLTGLDGHHFVVRRAGRWLATPLLLALLAVEASDLLFAIDSIPAVFSVSDSPFIVYSSNLFAILGLRALYLVLESALAGLRYLRHGLAAVLCFGGAKLLSAPWLPISPAQSLAVIAAMLGLAVAASLFAARANEVRPPGNEPS